VARSLYKMKIVLTSAIGMLNRIVFCEHHFACFIMKRAYLSLILYRKSRSKT